MKFLIAIWITFFIATASIGHEEDNYDSSNSMAPVSSGSGVSYFYNEELSYENYDLGDENTVLDVDNSSDFEDYSENDDELDPDDEYNEEDNDLNDASTQESKYSQKSNTLGAATLNKKPKKKKDKEDADAPYPPPYMISRINFLDTCNKEAKYYLKEHCPNCPAKCCLAKYRRICKSGFRFYDSSPSARKEQSKKGVSSKACSPACKPYHSFVIASIKCRKKIRSTCNYIWTLMPYFTPPPSIRMCCGMHYVTQVCLPAWNDQKLYKLPELYIEMQSNVCRLLMVPNFLHQACKKWLQEYYVNKELKLAFAPPGLNKFDKRSNCSM